MHRAARRRAARPARRRDGPERRGRGQRQIHRERRRRRGRQVRRAGRCADRVLAAGEAGIRRPAGGPPPARVRRDLLQLGVVPHPAPRLLPQRFPVRAPGGGHRLPGQQPAVVPGLLPGGRRPAEKPDPHGGRLRAGAAVRGPAARHAPAGPRRRQATARATAAPRRPAHRQRLPDPCAGLVVLPQQGRLHRRPADQPDHRLPLRRGAHAQPGRTGDAGRAAAGRRRPEHAVQLHARLFPGGHGNAGRRGQLPVHAAAARPRPSCTP